MTTRVSRPRLRRRIDEQDVTAEARHLGGREDLLLLELAAMT